MGERRKSNSKDTMLPHHDARTAATVRPTTVKLTTAETLATAWKMPRA
jgi:hypothetical protein